MQKKDGVFMGDMIIARLSELLLSFDVRSYGLLKDIFYKGVLLKYCENCPMYEVQKQHEIINYFDFKRIVDAT